MQQLALVIWQQLSLVIQRTNPSTILYLLPLVIFLHLVLHHVFGV